MKKILSTIIILATLIPNITFGAFAVPWSATSTSQGWVSPNTVNGVNFIVRAISFIASSTTSSSIFPYASTTALSAGTLCLTADTCRTTWPTGGSSVGWASTTADINSIYFTGNNIGKVGIGSSSPYASLAVTNTGTSPSFVVEDSTSPDTTPFIIDASGNVGVGTTTPGQKLSVAGDILGNNFIGSYFTGTSTTVSTFNGPLNTSGTTGGYRIDNTLILQASSTNFSTLLGQSAGAATLADGLYNTAIGYQALMTATSTDGNTGVGYQALKANTVGANNTALGYISLAANTTGSSNTAVGYRSLRNNTTGDFNTALGTYALDVNTTGGYNTSIGFATLISNTTGNYNTANGYEALLYNTTGSSNNASGYFSLAANTTGNSNTASGHNSMSSNITGSENTSIGYGSLRFNQSATSSTAFGFAAGYGASAPYSNQGGVYIGYTSGYSAMNGSDYNTLIGYKSGYGITTGARNVFLGNSTIAASYNQVTTGSNNISIGNDVAVPSATADNQLSIGNLIYGSGLDGTGATVSSGYIGIGSSTPYAKLSITNTGTSPSFVVEDSTSPDGSPFIIDASGNVGVGTSSPDIYSLGLTKHLTLSTNGASVSSASMLVAGGTTGRARLDLGNESILRAGVWGIDGSHLTFNTNASNSGTTLTEAMRITSSGNVGIGTTTPISLLNVASTDARITLTDTDAATNVKHMVLRSSSGRLGIGTMADNLVTLSEALTISGVTDYVGIGTTTPYAKLAITNTGSDPSFVVEDSTSPDTTPFIIDASGNVGIGTTTPGAKLNIAGVSTMFEALRLENNFNWAADRGTKITFYTPYSSGQTKLGGEIVVANNASVSSNDMYFTTDTNGVVTEKMRITNSGNVGIGTTSPSTKLNVWATGSALSVGDDTNTSTNMAIAGSRAYVGYDATDAVLQGASGKGIKFNVNNGTFGSGTAAVINTSGYFGIGTTSPSVGLTIGSGISYLCPQVLLSTSTSMTVDFNAGCNQIVRMGTSNTTISFTNGQPGQKLELTVCNPTTTSGNITFSGNMSYPGGLAPSHTTTANECDIYNFGVNYATTTAKYLLTGMQSGFK